MKARAARRAGVVALRAATLALRAGPPARPRFDRVVFDVDSTLSRIEGIDELARLRGADVSALTERAMRGEVALEDVYGLRLDLVRPNARMLAAVGALYVERRSPGAATLVRELEASCVEVWIVSGALRPALLPLAASLGVPGHRVFAVDLSLDARGEYAGFDARSPLARADGKRVVLEALRDVRRRTVLVGDGATDLAARPAVDAFVAYTGVARREDVARSADFSARTFSELRALLLPRHG